MFLLPSKSRDSLCAQSRFRDKKEKARTDCLLEFGVPGGTGEPPARVPHAKTVPRTVLPPLLRFCGGKEFRSVRGATKGFTFGFHRL